MIQKKDDKKPEHEPFKIRSLMLDMDEYLRVFILPQIPVEQKDFRDVMKATMDKAWHEMYYAAQTTRRPRQNHLVSLKIELAMLEIYLEEIRDVCYRGKRKKLLDKNSARRFEVFAKKQKEVMKFVWAWTKNEDARMNSKRTAKTVKMIEQEEI